jgi:trimeric autotransporter adhesin
MLGSITVLTVEPSLKEDNNTEIQGGQNIMIIFRYLVKTLLTIIVTLATFITIGCYPGGGILSIPVTLSSQELVPPRNNSSSGTGVIAINRNNGELSGDLTVTGFSAIAMHIHTGFAGEIGGFPVKLERDGVDQNLFRVPAKAKLSVALTNRLLAGGLYINAHSDANPAGEARGQIIPPNITVFWTTMSASEVVPPTLTSATAQAALTLNRITGLLRGNIRLSGLTATAINIQRGIAGENGSIAYTLHIDELDSTIYRVPPYQFIPPSDVTQMMNGMMYLNTESLDTFTVIRGQIFPKNIKVYINNLDGGQVVPPTQSNAFARSYITSNDQVNGIVGSVHVAGMTPTDVHLHFGAAGVTGEILSAFERDNLLENLFHIPPDTVLSSGNFEALMLGNTYINAHSVNFPEGEIRGQLN